MTSSVKTFTRDEIQEAREIAINLIAEKIAPMLPVNFRSMPMRTSYDEIRINIEQAFAVSCDLYFTPSIYGHNKNLKELRDEIRGQKVKLSWSSTSRDLANAQASLALYGKMIEIGALIEVIFPEMMEMALRQVAAKETNAAN